MSEMNKANTMRSISNRFTTAGDAVMGIGVESTQLLEVALELGRPTELFLANGGLAAEVRGRVERAFHKAFMAGMFKVNSSKLILSTDVMTLCDRARSTITDPDLKHAPPSIS